MNHDKVVDIIDDRMSKSRESLAQTFNSLFIEHKNEVKQTIKETVNGKIDKIQTQMNAQDVVLNSHGIILAEVKSLLEERKFAIKLWSFLKVIGGTMVSIGGAIILYKNIFK